MSFLMIGVCELRSRSMLLVRLRIWAPLTSSRLTLKGSVLLSRSTTLQEADHSEEHQLLLCLIILKLVKLFIMKWSNTCPPSSSLAAQGLCRKTGEMQKNQDWIILKDKIFKTTEHFWFPHTHTNIQSKAMFSQLTLQLSSLITIASGAVSVWFSATASLARSCSISWIREQFLSISTSRAETAARSSISRWDRVILRSSSRAAWISWYFCMMLCLITEDLFWIRHRRLSVDASCSLTV